MIVSILFYLFAGLAIIGSLFILLTEKIVYAAFSLLLILLSIAAIFVLAGSEFLAVTQIMVYAGGILILLIFGVLMTTKLQDGEILVPKSNKFWSLLLGGGFFILLFFMISQVNFALLSWMQGPEKAVGEGMINKLGTLLMSDYVLVFELAGIILLVALVAAALLAGERIKEGIKS